MPTRPRCPGSPDDRHELLRGNRDGEGIQGPPIIKGLGHAVKDDNRRDWAGHDARKGIQFPMLRGAGSLEHPEGRVASADDTQDRLHPDGNEGAKAPKRRNRGFTEGFLAGPYRGGRCGLSCHRLTLRVVIVPASATALDARRGIRARTLAQPHGTSPNHFVRAETYDP